MSIEPMAVSGTLDDEISAALRRYGPLTVRELMHVTGRGKSSIMQALNRGRFQAAPIYACAAVLRCSHTGRLARTYKLRRGGGVR